MKKKIFLDCASTTPIAKQVLKEILKMSKLYANPSSKHFLGEETRQKVEKARKEISEYLNCEPEEIFFTSGGTEGNNTILKGLAEKYPERKHVIISEIEHPAIIETCRYLEKKRYRIDKISVDNEGIINLEELKSKITQNTLVVSIMHINNEIGTIQPIEEISRICQEKKVFFHSDMVQSLGKLDIDIKKVGLDFASFSGHKINAPKGIGFLFIKKGIDLEPLIHGGNQEKGLRSGTENLTGIFSLPIALKLERNQDSIRKQRDYLLREILKIPGAILNGSSKKRIFNNINVSFYGIEGESLMLLLSKKGICVSTGSACNSNKLAENHVLKAIKLDEMYLNGSIRITIDKLTKKELSFVLDSIKESVKKLQKISPFKYESSTKLQEVK